ncbi:uncharacterized protein RSE6_01827 [Rhynchosporium secalis]|uniref:BTB domain-containing protein n=1 Tax=Rhynchosporium secalis TaxID=38038 RepID=A0A1E1LYR7_RHYSE|nr:uncharacterized protein RSE6_01827 [Rhynchosporium secalis]
MSPSKASTGASLPAAGKVGEVTSGLIVTSLFSPQPVFTVIIKTKNNQEMFNNNLPTSAHEETSNHKFIIHKNIICHHSPFFAAALIAISAREENTQVIIFDDIVPILFGSFVHWLYRKTVAADGGVVPAPEMMVGLRIMAERFLIPTMQDQIMDKLFEAIRSQFSIPTINATAKAIHESGSKVLISMLLNRISHERGSIRDAWVGGLSIELLRRFAKGQFDHSPGSSSKIYHVAARVEEKAKSKPLLSIHSYKLSGDLGSGFKSRPSKRSRNDIEHEDWFHGVTTR